MTLAELITQQAKEAGVEFKKTGPEIATYLREQSVILAQASTEPGYDIALHRATRNALEFAAGEGVDEGDAVDQRLWGVFVTALGILAGAA